MAQYERSSESAAGPGNGFATGGLAAVQSIANTMMRGNMEMMGLVSRRTRANMDLAKQAVTCRTTAEIGQLGTEFWSEAFQDYVHCNQRLMALWMENMKAVGQGDLARTASELASRLTEPMAAAVKEAGAGLAEMAEHPAEPWAWWRTDVKGLKPHRNGHTSEEAAARVGY